MKFIYTYEQTSFNNFYKPYYAIDDKRVNKTKFDNMVTYCKLIGMNYNCSYMTHKGNRTKLTFYYD